MPVITFAKVIEFLWQFKIFFVIAALLAAILFQSMQLKAKDVKIGKLYDNIAEQEAEIKTLKQDIQVANEEIDIQNAAVDAYLEAAADLAKELEKTKAESVKSDSKLRKELADMKKKWPIPKECPGVLDWLRDRALENAALYGENVL